MKTLLALLLGKTISILTKSLKIGGGSAAPGLYGLKLDPELVRLARQIPKNIVITGTNGKTTTAKMISHFAKSSGLKVIKNSTGSNLERGIASSLIQHSMVNLRGCRLDFDLGVWELDEAAFNKVTPKIKPDIVIFLNIYRDQLDRYGEIDTVLKKWCKTLKNMPKDTIILINGDDTNTLKLAEYFKGKVITFGVKGSKLFGESPKKEKSAQKLDFEAENIKLNGLTSSSFQLSINNDLLTINLPLPGLYHIYDALAAIVCSRYLNLSTKLFSKYLKSYIPAFGRVERFSLQPSRLHRKDDGYIFLVKNPAGATQVFETIAPVLKPQDRLLLALNDNLADGTDISWIWDAKFEQLLQCHPELASGSKRKTPKQVRHDIICSGTRAYDLAVRLKYAGFEPKDIMIEPKLENALKQARKGLKGTLFVLPTYTAMLELQGILTKQGIKKHYWEEK